MTTYEKLSKDLSALKAQYTEELTELIVLQMPAKPVEPCVATDSMYYSFNDLKIADHELPIYSQSKVAEYIHGKMHTKSTLNLEVSAYGFENLSMSLPSSNGMLVVIRNDTSSTWEWTDDKGEKYHAMLNTEWSGWKSITAEPLLKQDIYSGVTCDSQGGSTKTKHGLNVVKIVDVRVTVNEGSYIILPHHKAGGSGYEYELYIDREDVVIKNVSRNSGNILKKPFYVVISSMR